FVVGRRMLVDVLEFMLAEPDDVTVAQRMLLDELAVHIGPVGAAEILQEGIIENRDDEGVLSADGKVVDLDVVIGLATNVYPFLPELEFPLNRPVHAQNQLCHWSVLFSCPFSESY